MKKKRLWALIGVASFALSSIIIYWLYFSEPADFPKHEQLAEEIQSTFPEASESVIQDTIHIDEDHVIVPFISNEDHYGLSYWVWEEHKWQVVEIDTGGQPIIWKINRKDPSSYQIVWNIHPEDQLSSIHFYLIRDRGYHVSEGKENYVPRVQMGEQVSLKETSYGAMHLPDDWVAVIDTLSKVEASDQSNLFITNSSIEQSMKFGWIPYDEAGNEAFPEQSVNGMSNGHVDKEHLMIMNKSEIEKPK